MKTLEENIEFIESAFECGIIWLVLGSLVSADSCVDIESCEKNLELSDSFIEALENSTKIPEKDKQKLISYLKKGKNIISADLKEFKEQKEKGN